MNALRVWMAIMVAVVALSATPSRAQISTPCNASMIASFTPCLGFLTNSTANGTSPTQDCCDALRAVTGSSMDCACLIVTGSVPFQVPINRTLAVSLPRACNMPGVPLQCKATGAPIPAPGPNSFAPTMSPIGSPTGSSFPVPISPALSPVSDTPLLTPPPTTTDGAESPAGTTGSRPSLTPSSAVSIHSLSASTLLSVVGFLVMKYLL